MFKNTRTLKIGIYEFKVYKKQGEDKEYIQLMEIIKTLGYSECYGTHLTRYLNQKDWTRCKSIIGHKEVNCKLVTIRGFYELISVSRIDIAHDIRCELFKMIDL